MAKKRKKPRPLPQSLGLPPIGVETHAHLDLEDFAGEVDEVLDRAREAGVARVGNVFMGAEAYHRGKGLFAHRPEVFFILGTHPHDAAKVADDYLDAARAAFAGDGRIKAVGEIGLDFYYDYAPRQLQERVFGEQLDLARELDVPAVIHSRDALAETLAVLDKADFSGRPLVWHCFGGDGAMAREILDRGWTISLPGIVTWRKMDDLREAVAEIPLDRLVLETDCPFLAADPWRGKRNEPALMAFTCACVAELKGLEPELVWRATADNATRVFRL